jgi:hypothetical protein
MWWLAAAALMLLLPRQYWAAGFAAGIATVLWFLDRRLNPRPKGGAKPTTSLMQSTLPRRE